MVTAAVSISAEKLATYELCPRRYRWTDDYEPLRISLVRAMYVALDAGLRTDGDSERTATDTFLSLAAKPGLDIEGGNVYAIAHHHACLVGLLAFALRGTLQAPWAPVDPVTLPDGSEWHSGLYNAGAGYPTRLVLVDRWTDDRRAQEIAGWRTVGEACALNEPILLTAITIGPSQGQRRHSAWTRCYRHPRNRTFRFMRKGTDEDFSRTWTRVWREDSNLPTAAWLDRMKEDGCMEELVHSVRVPPPAYRDAYLREMGRMAAEIAALPPTPPMRLAGCYGFSPCPFLGVCPATKPNVLGFRARSDMKSVAQHAGYVTVSV